MSFSRRVRAGALALLLCSVSAGAARAETLREALTSAYLNNPQILSALLNVKATAENIALAKSAKLPSIGLSATETQSVTFGVSTSGPTIAVGASISQSIFDNFKSDADLEAARALTEASRYSLQNSEQNVLLAVVEAYFNIIRDTQLVQVRQENVKFYQAQVDSAKDRLKIGEGTKIDVSQAEARLAQGTASYQSAVASLQTSQASYERYVGHKPKNLTTTYRLGTLLPKSLDAAISEAVMSHPAILSARAGIRAAQANSDSANAAFGPTLDMVGSIGSTVFGGGFLSPPNPTATLKFTLAVPIYAGGALGASIRKANINQIKSEVDALAARDQIKESLISAWSSMQNASAQIESANSAVAAGELSLEGIVQERDVGQATTLDVLNAQSELTTVKEGLISASAAKVIASFAVVAATGHLTASDLSLDVEIQTGEDYIAKVEDVWAELRALD
ncbi:MAG: TolC family outer membrane protein [Devosia nanyangense]|uniref:TolC family outer membrane protein n=1 Tax=Devosia nanyangense TaxID=1228055 RepID=A0A933P026_9HYPH|nr:TolC family outer membrane protein [Devosia nanyangense]